MTSTQKKNPGGQAGARKTDSRSDQRSAKASLEERKGPGPRFWLKTDDITGEELAFEREPDLPHLTVDVVTPSRDTPFERTRTAARRVREAFARQGWVLTSNSWEERNATWRRRLSSDWQLLSPEEAKDAYPGLGRVWRRHPPAKGGES